MSKEYKWETMSDKDVFKMKLEGDSPDFGYISCSRRRRFVTFLERYNFVKVVSRHVDTKFPVRYDVLCPFRYSQMGNYRADPMSIRTEHAMFVDRSSKMFFSTK